VLEVATEIVMPKLGMGMEKGTVVAWQKQVGDPVQKGETLVEIRSEKIEFEVEAPEDGVLLDIAVPNEGVVPCGTIIGYVGSPAELVNTDSSHVTQTTAVAVAAPPQKKIKISPVAKKMAEAAGLRIDSIVGTGPDGRITKEDVERAIAAGSPDVSPHVETKPTTAPPSLAAKIPEENIQHLSAAPSEPAKVFVTGMRKAIANRMLQSLQQTAQLTITMSADVTDALEIQRQHGERIRERYDTKLTVTDFVARATVLALLEHPQVNSVFSDSEILQHTEVHLGIAVALDDGLIVPTIRNADRLSFIDLAKAVKSVSQRARSGKLHGEETGGSTFTITNLGAYGVEYFTPILNPPETGILGVGSVQDQPRYIGSELQRRSILPLSLTFDHRALDGAPAAQFLGTVKRYLETPIHLLL
jgi:pyruvate dehydrogenase E2 component (dihydrolipoamide acetyltransferase)